MFRANYAISLLFAIVLIQPALAADDPPGGWTHKRIMFRGDIPNLQSADVNGELVEGKRVADPVVEVLAEEEDWLGLDSRGEQGWVDKSAAILLEEAPAYFADVIQANSKDASAYANRGIAFCALGEFDKSIKDCTEALRLDPKNTWALLARGGAWRNKRDFAKAIADFTEAIRLDPSCDTGFRSRANVWSSKKEYDKAITDYNEALRLEPNDVWTLILRAGVWVYKKEYDKAIADCTEALNLYPELPAALQARGKCWLFKEEYDKAIADFAEAIRLDPKDVDALHWRVLRPECQERIRQGRSGFHGSTPA